MIDLSPYWRPAEFATAIVVADAIAWEGAGVAELKPAMGVDRFGQLPVRAILYRLVADLIAARPLDRVARSRECGGRCGR